MTAPTYSLASLNALASLYDGRSCGEEGKSKDSIKGSDGAKGKRLDADGTFQDRNECCLVQKCVFGEVGAACKDLDLTCPSSRGRFDPRTCREEQPVMKDDVEVNDDAHREGFFGTREECCEHFVRLGGGCAERRSPDMPADPLEEACCSANDQAKGGAARGDEDFLTA